MPTMPSGAAVSFGDFCHPFTTLHTVSTGANPSKTLHKTSHKKFDRLPRLWNCKNPPESVEPSREQPERTAMGKDMKNDMEISHPDSVPAELELSCPSHHTHSYRLPLSEFSLKSLPTPLRCDAALAYVRSIGNMVVMVKVSGVSSKRGWDKQFTDPTITRQGSGMICYVGQDIEQQNMDACSCSGCKGEHVPPPTRVFFYVMTAAHVVYDAVEAENTTICYKNDSLEDTSLFPFKSWTAKVADVVYPCDSDRDLIFLKCYSQDSDVLEHVTYATEGMAHATKALQEVDLDTSSSCDKLMAFIISHPHGLPKHISFGSVHVLDEKDLEFDLTTGEKKRGTLCYSYEVDTCPGSSGAPVCILGLDEARYCLAPHSSKEEGKGQTEGLVEWMLD